MVWYDVVVLAILGFTAWRGAQRGLVSQLAWITAIVLCFKFADTLAPSITPHIGVGEPNDRVRHWIAMFILFVGFSVASFLVARSLESTLEQAKLKELDRFLGGVLGLVFGGTVVLVATFFTAVLQPTQAAVLESRTGHLACEILDTLKPLTPEHFHDYLVEYQSRLNHENHEHLGEGTNLPDFLGDNEDLNAGGQGGFNALEFGTGLAEEFSSGRAGSSDSTSSGRGPGLDRLWRALPDQLRTELGSQIQQRWESATPQQRESFVSELERKFPFEAPDVVRQFFSSATDSGSRPATQNRRPDIRTMMTEIGDIYRDREQIIRRTEEHLAGVPSQVKEAVIRDWYADLNLETDPDPSTSVQTRLDERILRQLDRARVPLTSLDYSLQQRLNRSRQ